MQVHIVSFAPAHESRASVGGFEWRFDLDDALKEYHNQLADSRESQGSHIVRLLSLAVPDGLSNEEITDDLDARLDEFENAARALRQYVPADSQYPPAGGADIEEV